MDRVVGLFEDRLFALEAVFQHKNIVGQEIHYLTLLVTKLILVLHNPVFTFILTDLLFHFTDLHLKFDLVIIFDRGLAASKRPIIIHALLYRGASVWVQWYAIAMHLRPIHETFDFILYDILLDFESTLRFLQLLLTSIFPG